MVQSRNSKLEIQRLYNVKTKMPGWFKLLLTPLGVLASGIYGLGVFSRLALYRLGLLPVHRLPLSVISLGNLVVGGTGKTPHTALIADHFRRRGRKVVILSRGYGGEKSTQGAVISSPEKIIGTVQEGGEEPFWLAEHLPGVAVVIGKNRYQAGLLSRERWGVESGYPGRWVSACRSGAGGQYSTHSSPPTLWDGGTAPSGHPPGTPETDQKGRCGHHQPHGNDRRQGTVRPGRTGQSPPSRGARFFFPSCSPRGLEISGRVNPGLCPG